MLFDNNVKSFARAIEIDQTHLGKVFKRQYAVSVQLLAQILSHTTVRADWLMWGSGPMLAKRKVDTPTPLALPEQLRSSFPLFNCLTTVTPAKDAMSPYAIETACKMSAAHVSAAQAIHRARSNDRPVLLFISAPAISSGAGIASVELLKKKYVTAVATTGAGLIADVLCTSTERPDFNYIAHMAAKQGIGYGEAVGRWAFEPRSNKSRSLLHSAYSAGVPASVHVEIGEMCGHLYPGARGAETGAAIGAATYVDLMIFAEQVRQLCSTSDGVALFIGDVMRGLHLFLQTLVSLPRGGEQRGFHAVLIDNHVQSDFASYVHSHHGILHELKGTYKANVISLLNACDGVFSGQITQTIEPSPNVSGQISDT